jgi:hypothetical protein
LTGKTWSRDEEKKLIQFSEAGDSFSEIAEKLGKSEESVRAKMKRLGLDDNKHAKSECLSSNNLNLPEDLPSVEEQLKVIAAAVAALQTPGLKREETIRLHNLIKGAEAYIDRFAQYLNYRDLEAKVNKLIQELDKKDDA